MGKKKGKNNKDEESKEEFIDENNSEEEEPKSKRKSNKKEPKINDITPIMKKIDNKELVDDKFKERKKYHVFPDNDNTFNGKNYSCNLTNSENNKFYVIQLLEKDDNNSLILFTRWGKICSPGEQKIELVDSISGPKLFMKKHKDKKKGGHKEEFEFNNEDEDEKEEEKKSSKKSKKSDDSPQKILELFKKKTERKCYTYEESIEENLGIFDDKIGGHPYLPKSINYPKNSKGQNMALLLQINLSKYELDGFPNKGIFEIFHEIDPGNGRTSEYKIFLFDENLEYQTKFPEIDYSGFFCEKPIKLTFKEDISYMNQFDNNFEPTVLKCIEEITKEKFENLNNFYEEYNIDEFDFLDKFETHGFAQYGLGVWPDFIQEDTRDEQTKDYVNIFGFTSSENIFFNDCARGWILIDKNDLKNGKVEQAIFEYDMT